MAEDKTKKKAKPERGGQITKEESNGRAFGRLLGYIFFHYKVQLIVVMVCIVISAFSSVIATIFLQRLIDEVITPGLQSGIQSVAVQMVRILTTMGIIYALGVIAAAIYSRIMAVVTQGTLYNLRRDMFNKMETLPIRYFDTHAHGDIMSTYTNDTDAIRMLITQSLPQMFQAILTMLAIFVMMLYYSIWLTLVVVLVLIIMFSITGKVGGASAKYMVAQQKSLATTEGFIEEMMSGQKVVKVFNHEEKAKDDFIKLNNQLFDDGVKANMAGNQLMPILGNVGNIMYVVLAIVGGILIGIRATNFSLQGVSAITAGVIVSFLSMSRQLSQTVGQVSAQVAIVAQGVAGAGRVFQLIDEEPEHDDGYVELVNAQYDKDGNLEPADHHTGIWAWKHYHKATNTTDYKRQEGALEMVDVDFWYNPDKIVLHDITLYAKPGQKIAFVGATGAGKTTITNLINRFYDIPDGKIRYDGININKIKKPDLRRSLGMVLQEVNLFTGTVMDNIRYGKLDATDEECIAAAKLANADDFITRLPDGYDTMLTGNGSQLSQGQRQLISIARAAVGNPPAMILDEATSSIDTRTEALVQAGMDNLMKGRTVFVIAHRLSTVRNSDSIMVLDHGRIIERGTHDELIAKKGTYYQLYTGAFELE